MLLITPARAFPAQIWERQPRGFNFLPEAGQGSEQRSPHPRQAAARAEGTCLVILGQALSFPVENVGWGCLRLSGENPKSLVTTFPAKKRHFISQCKLEECPKERVARPRVFLQGAIVFFFGPGLKQEHAASAWLWSLASSRAAAGFHWFSLSTWFRQPGLCRHWLQALLRAFSRCHREAWNVPASGASRFLDSVLSLIFHCSVFLLRIWLLTVHLLPSQSGPLAPCSRERRHEALLAQQARPLRCHYRALTGGKTQAGIARAQSVVSLPMVLVVPELCLLGSVGKQKGMARKKKRFGTAGRAEPGVAAMCSSCSVAMRPDDSVLCEVGPSFSCGVTFLPELIHQMFHSLSWLGPLTELPSVGRLSVLRLVELLLLTAMLLVLQVLITAH